MPYCRRIHVPGGTYYTVRKTFPPLQIFDGSDDYEEFEDFLVFALEATGVKLLGYCWMPDAIHLVVTVGRKRLADLMRKVTTYCSRRIRQRAMSAVSPFPTTFPTTLIDPETYLASLIQYIHYIPVLCGVATTPDEYPHTSHLTYLGHKQHLRVHTKPLMTILRHGLH